MDRTKLVLYGCFLFVVGPLLGAERADWRWQRQKAVARPINGLALRDLAEVFAAGAPGSPTTISLSVESVGSNVVTAAPLEIVSYQVVGLLSDDDNQGLALIGFNLVFDGGDLEQADEPLGEPTPGCDNPMINFARPWGVTNPTGLGGTVIDGDLIQIGGSQNTINNVDDAEFPIGPVLLGVAHPSGCGAAVIVTGQLTAPSVEGEYTLAAEEVFANVIRADASEDDEFWATESAVPGALDPLIIQVGPANECAAGSHNCDENATCIDTTDGFSCTCNPGYEGTGESCVPAVCFGQSGSTACSGNGMCIYRDTCRCRAGWAGDACQFRRRVRASVDDASPVPDP